jgi:hypothetical protein
MAIFTKHGFLNFIFIIFSEVVREFNSSNRFEYLMDLSHLYWFFIYIFFFLIFIFIVISIYVYVHI